MGVVVFADNTQYDIAMTSGTSEVTLSANSTVDGAPATVSNLSITINNEPVSADEIGTVVALAAGAVTYRYNRS